MNDNDGAAKAELEAENRKLLASLSKCQALVAECRERLAARTAPAPADEQEAQQRNGA